MRMLVKIHAVAINRNLRGGPVAIDVNVNFSCLKINLTAIKCLSVSKRLYGKEN